MLSWCGQSIWLKIWNPKDNQEKVRDGLTGGMNSLALSVIGSMPLALQSKVGAGTLQALNLLLLLGPRATLVLWGEESVIKYEMIY